MSLFSYLRRLYSLDTLDTRFTVSSTAPIGKTSSEHGVEVDKPAQSASVEQAKKQYQDLPIGAQPSKWATPEYLFYALVVAVMLPWMFAVAINVSKGKVTR